MKHYLAMKYYYYQAVATTDLLIIIGISNNFEKMLAPITPEA